MPTYAIVAALFAIVSLSSLRALTKESEEYLIDSGSTIGTPTDRRATAVTAPLTAPSGWGRAQPPPDPAAIFTEQSLSLDGGTTCVGIGSSSRLELVPCGDPTSLVLTLQPRGSGANELVTSDSFCLGTTANPDVPLSVTTCGRLETDWSFSGGDPYRFSSAASATSGPEPLCWAPEDIALGSRVVLEPCASNPIPFGSWS